jgi:hypothetical protein
VSSKTPWDSFRICSSAELSDDRDVDEADWRGESEGVAAVEFVEVTDCCVVFRLRFGFTLGRAVVDIVAVEGEVAGEKTALPKVLKSVALLFSFAVVGPQLAVGRISFVGNGGLAEWDFPSYRSRRIARARAEGMLWGLIRVGG